PPTPALPPAPTVAPVRRPDAGAVAPPNPILEPPLTDPRFSGKTRSEWRELYNKRLHDMHEELDVARDLGERGKSGANIPLDEVRRAHTHMRDLERRIQIEEQTLGELERAQ